MTPATDHKHPQLAIVGGGLAGMAAAVAAVERGFHVELFEQGKTLGGRAGSFVDPTTGETIDLCQHVAMGCCTEFLDFCRRTGIDDCFKHVSTIHFIGPEGNQCDFATSRWLPPPLHLLPGLMRLNYLSWSERWSIVRTMNKLIHVQQDSTTENSRGPTARGDATNEHRGPLAPGYLNEHRPPLAKGEGTIGSWLRRHGQSERTIERFWSVVLLSALSETVDRSSLAAAQKVFRDGFWASRQASEVVLPRWPLAEIFHHRLGKWLAEHGVNVHLATPVQKIEGDGQRVTSLTLSDGTRKEFDSAIVAVPWRRIRTLFDEPLLSQMPALADVERIEPAAITAIHLWFDRPITRLPHAALVGRLSQWLFTRPCNAEKASTSHYYQVVVSASHRLVSQKKHGEWLADVRGELESIWPEAKQAKLLHSRAITQPAAVFSVTPELERFRPPQQTPLKNLCLAGDWTSTGWPGTMEGAIRSGRKAVESLLG